MEQLPNEIIREVLGNLELPQRFALERINKIFRFISKSFPYFKRISDNWYIYYCVTSKNRYFQKIIK